MNTHGLMDVKRFINTTYIIQFLNSMLYGSTAILILQYVTNQQITAVQYMTATRPHDSSFSHAGLDVIARMIILLP